LLTFEDKSSLSSTLGSEYVDDVDVDVVFCWLELFEDKESAELFFEFDGVVSFFFSANFFNVAFRVEFDL
jgi:hypothetical protein